MGEQLTTAFGVITTAAAPYGVVVQGQTYEAADPIGFAPAVGNSVLVDWLPSAGQWVVVAIVP